MVSNSTHTGNRRAVLNLFGAASLTINGEQVSLTRKALALLYYLAVEGPTSRERLAELLWGHSGANRNLRVELHRARAAFAAHDMPIFQHASDPLRLGREVTLDTTPRTGIEMEGLEDLTPQFQDWLDLQRVASTREAGGHLRTGLLDELASRVTPPYVLVLVGAPGSGRAQFAQALAVRLGLPFKSGGGTLGAALHYEEAERATVERATAIAQADTGVHVIARSVFGEDPEFLLKLRAEADPERLRFVKLEPLKWWEAQAALPPGMPFTMGARYYLASHGNAYYLRELLKLRDPNHSDEPLPVPLTVRAKFALATRRLSAGARGALETLSVLKYWSSDTGSPAGSDFPQAMEELEREGWVNFDGEGWRFKQELARTLVLDTVPSGKRHRLGAAQPTPTAVTLSGGSTPVISATVLPEAPVWLDAPDLAGDAALVPGGIALARTCPHAKPPTITWELPDAPLLVKLSGKAVRGDADPRIAPLLRVWVVAPGAKELWLSDGCPTSAPRDVLALHSESARFQHHLLLPPGIELRVEVAAEQAVSQLAVEAWEYSLHEPANARDALSVEAVWVTGEPASNAPPSETEAPVVVPIT